MITPAGPYLRSLGTRITNEDNSVMLNLFTRYYGLEFFGTLEQAKGASFRRIEFKFNQYAAEALYHFGGDDQFYGGARYNYVKNDADKMLIAMKLLPAGI